MDAYFLSKTWSVTMKSAVGLFTATARNLRKSAVRRLYTPRKNRKQKSNSRTREFTRNHWTFFCTSTEGPGISPTPNFSVPLVEPLDHGWFRRATKNHPEGKTKTDEERDRAWIESPGLNRQLNLWDLRLCSSTYVSESVKLSIRLE